MRKNSFIVVVLIMLAVSFPAFAQNFDYASFGRIPIAHEGRIKPLSQFASLLYRNVTADEPSTQAEASAWLAAILFDPSGAVTLPQFRVANDRIAYALGLPSAVQTFDFEDINQAFIINKKLVADLQKSENLTDDERALLDLYGYTVAFEQTKDALTQSLPLLSGGDAQNPNSFSDLPVKHKLRRLLASKGAANDFLRVVPFDGDWLSPWQSALSPTPSPLLSLWKDAAAAYIHGDETAWKKATTLLADETVKASNEKTLSLRLAVETAYQDIDPFFYSFVFYMLGFLLAVASSRPSLRAATLSFVATGWILQAAGLAARMYILQRPPVSTLHESLLFVGFMTTGLFLVSAWRKKRIPFVAMAGFSGAAFYLISLAVQNGQDDLKVLEAVLNTRFWLATHVMAITTGYALCALASLTAHAHLASKAFRTKAYLSTRDFSARIYQLSVWSLLFVTGGTLLGGVWADQSWGRFWGWDPKENGALLIVLWLTWALHAKLSKRFDAAQFNLCIALLSIVVAFSWMGVNLLGVGLHSYGFTQGMATGFASFCALDIIVLLFLWKRGRSHGPHA